MHTWWLVAALVVGSSVARADSKGASSSVIRNPPAMTYAALFKAGKTWTFASKHSLAHEGEVNKWSTTVRCKVTASTTIGAALRSTITCTSAQKRQSFGELRILTIVATDEAIWLVPDETTTETQIAALDSTRAWIADSPTNERSWTEQVPVPGSGSGAMQTRSSWAVVWRGASCLLVREPPEDEQVLCAAPGKGLIGVRDLEWTDGYSFGAIPTPKQVARWK